MWVEFYGVRGSIASPAGETMKYGGNTSCVRVTLDDGTNVIFDTGTGARKLGLNMMKNCFGKGQGKAHIFYSHYHHDHTEGFPFFVPAYIKGNELVVFGEKKELTVKEVLDLQQKSPIFPVSLDYMAATKQFENLQHGDEARIGSNGTVVKCAKLNHPNSVLAYRLEDLVYATDVEPEPESEKRLVELAQGAKMLIIDGQYTPEEYPAKKGWGHGTYVDAARIAKAAGVKRVVLFHHEPTHSDNDLDAILERAKLVFPNTIMARENLEIEL